MLNEIFFQCYLLRRANTNKSGKLQSKGGRPPAPPAPPAPPPGGGRVGRGGGKLFLGSLFIIHASNKEMSPVSSAS